VVTMTVANVEFAMSYIAQPTSSFRLATNSLSARRARRVCSMRNVDRSRLENVSEEAMAELGLASSEIGRDLWHFVDFDLWW
jgi:hypothetical protein